MDGNCKIPGSPPGNGGGKEIGGAKEVLVVCSVDSGGSWSKVSQKLRLFGNVHSEVCFLRREGQRRWENPRSFRPKNYTSVFLFPVPFRNRICIFPTTHAKR